MRKAILMGVLACAIVGPLHAEPIPSQVQSNALIEAIAERGLECGQLKRWQNLSLRALALEDRRRWDAHKRGKLEAARSDQLADMDCESELMTAWIEAAREGFDYEMLPPYLIVYEAMAGMETPPHVFSAVSLRADRTPVIDAVHAKLDILSTSGRNAEGGKPWPEYIETTRDHALSFVSQLETEDGDVAAAWIAQSAMIVEAWYDEEIN